MDVSQKTSKRIAEESTQSPLEDPPTALSKTPPTTASIPWLPNEIIDKILSFCDLGQRRKITLMSARLASRDLEKAACRHLFETVHVSLFGGWGLTEFQEIANSRFARHVQHLVMISFLPGFKIIENIEGPTFMTELDEEYMEDPNVENLEGLCENIDSNWIAFSDSIRKLPNIRAVSLSNPYGAVDEYSDIEPEIEPSDDMLTLTLLALSKQPYGSDHYRNLEIIEWQGGRKNSWTAPWQSYWDTDSDSNDSRPGDSNSRVFKPISSFLRSLESGPPFGMIKCLNLIDIPWPRESEFEDENMQGSLSHLCSNSRNPLESLTLDFQGEGSGVVDGSPEDFCLPDALQAYQGFSLSPNLTRLELSRLTTSASTLLTVLENTSSTLRDLTLNFVIISPFEESGWTFWDRNIRKFYEKFMADFVDPGIPTGKTFWEDVLLPIPKILPNLSSVCLADLLDTRPCFKESLESWEWRLLGARWLLTDAPEGLQNQTAVHDYLLRRSDLLPSLEAQEPSHGHSFWHELNRTFCAPCAFDDPRDYLQGSSLDAHGNITRFPAKKRKRCPG